MTTECSKNSNQTHLGYFFKTGRHKAHGINVCFLQDWPLQTHWVSFAHQVKDSKSLDDWLKEGDNRRPLTVHFSGVNMCWSASEDKSSRDANTLQSQQLEALRVMRLLTP